ncbi:MAG: CocE/NonD family hydrolase [Proteobacteria bacterium]|nr:CocE/NonD family hydrolase [Pseudomonadota bacterium]
MKFTEADFAAGPDVAVPAQSSGFDPAVPHLFDGLAPRYASKLLGTRFIAMRDGVRLSTDFHVPLGAKLPLPVILVRTPYGKNMAMPTLRAVFPEQGFVLAIQDIRGRGESEGMFVANLGIEREDGYDTVEWLARQSWCNGRIGAWGSSYLGETAARLAAMRHPNHRASIIMFDGSNAAGDYRNGAFLQGGVTMLWGLFNWLRHYVPAISYGPPPWIDREAWFSQSWSKLYPTQPVQLPPLDMMQHLRGLPVVDLMKTSGAPPTEFDAMMRHSHDPSDPYWEAQGFLTERDEFDAPALHVAGLQERGDSAFANVNLFREKSISAMSRDNQYLLLCPTPHSGYMGGSADTAWGPRRLGDTRFPYLKTFVDWFGRWLRDETDKTQDWPKVRYYVAGLNRWRHSDCWPPRSQESLCLYLHGAADTQLRRGCLAPDAPPDGAPSCFRYDPQDPTPSDPPGADLDSMGSGYADFSPLELRPDILIYTGAPLESDLDIVGHVTLDLYVSSSARDTDFAAVLLEVEETGAAINITHGIVRMRFRDGLDKTVWMESGQVYPVQIDMWIASVRIPKGRRLRLHISSSRFPFYDRNLNTGGDNATETESVVAENCIHHSLAHASRLTLPIVPAADG